MSRNRDLLYAGLAVLAVTALCLPLILVGPQKGSSIFMNLPWANGFAEQVLQGELYPRWLEDLNAGAGSPVFFFYGPVPFYFTTIGKVLCVDCSVVNVLGIGLWLMVVGSATSFFVFARQLAAPAISAIGAICYAVAPYHFGIDLLERQAVGEVAAYIWIPLIFLFINNIAVRPYAVVGLAVSYALLVMTHLPAALLVSLLLVPYCLVLWFSESRGPFALRCAIGLGVGLMLSAIYLVPALMLQGYISPDNWWNDYFHYSRWFFFDRISAPNWRFEDMLERTLLACSLIFAPAWIIAYRRHGGQPRAIAIGLLVLFIGAWFLMLPISRYAWELVPFLKNVQFPWRVMILVDFAVVSTLLLALQGALGRSTREVASRPLLLAAIAASVLFLWAGMTGIYQEYRIHWRLLDDAEQQAKLRYALTIGWDGAEYLPAAVELPRTEAWAKLAALPRLGYEPAAGRIDVDNWGPRRIELDVDLQRDAELLVKQFYYPWWRATIVDSGAELDVSAGASTSLIRITAPAGNYRLSLTLEKLWPETAGLLLSGLGILALLVGCWRASRASRTVAAADRT